MVFLDLDLLINEAGAVVLADEFRYALRSQESEQLGELVVYGAGCEFLLIAQEDDEAQQILSLDAFDVGLRAALREIAQPGLSLTGELNVLEKIRFGCAQRHRRVFSSSSTGSVTTSPRAIASSSDRFFFRLW